MKPAALEFEGAECEIDSTGDTMTCEFQQVFLTTSDFAPQTCMITTNRYDRKFRKQSSSRWISSAPPAGVCGIVETTTLQDDGGVKWTMETRRVVTKKDAAPECRNGDDRSETLSWQNLRRPLPCSFVQPGGLSR